MNFDSLRSLATDHDLYTLQHKESGVVQGFALVKKGQIIQSDLLEFVPVGDLDTVAAVADKQVSTVSDRSITCPNKIEEGKKRNSSHTESAPVHYDQQSHSSMWKESSKECTDPKTHFLQCDLNLSETSTSSNNETTLDECQSQASCTSSLVMMRKISPNLAEHHEDFADMKAQISPSQFSRTSATTDNTRLRSPLLSPNLVVKTENIFKQPQSEPVKLIPSFEDLKPDPHNSNGPPSSAMIASLAAEVISQIKSKVIRPNEMAINMGKVDTSTISRKEKEINNRLESQGDNEGILKITGRNRNAKQVMSEETFSLLSKPLDFGWKRECIVHGSEEVTKVYYRSPTRYKMKRRRFTSITKIGQYLAEVGETNLSPENFSVRKVFYGFEPAFETVRNSFRYNEGLNVSLTKTGWKYDSFFEVVSRGVNSGKRVKCLLCESVFSSKGNFGRHMKEKHEPDETCDLCGLQFRPVKFQDHRSRCLELVTIKSEKEIEERSETSSKEIPAKIMNNEQYLKTSRSDLSTISDVSKPVAVKSLPPISKSPDAPRPTFERALVTAGEEDTSNMAGNSGASEHISLNPFVNKTNSPNTHGSRMPSKSGSGSMSEEVPKTISYNDGGGQMAILVMTSTDGTRVKMQVKVNAKVVKGMKKFGLRVGVSHTDLRFLLDGVELTGEELAGGLDGANILVERRDC
eukprot:GFUD01017449.1.p1 GENE.GFUD01017449.1~~GFUD01017449.1.p1  ORF type:complete len:691 (-),score=168.21 GFUD01017449.1:69-2141(-)